MKRLIASLSTKRTESAMIAPTRSGDSPEHPDRAVCRPAARRSWLSLRRPQLLPGLQLPPRRELLILAMLAVLALCTGLAVYSVRPRPDGSGFDLRADDSSSSFNNTSAEEDMNRDRKSVV